MHVFRWVVAIVTGLIALGSVLCFAVYVMADMQLWLGRARWLRRLAFGVVLAWVNAEIWISVIRTIAHWSKG